MKEPPTRFDDPDFAFLAKAADIIFDLSASVSAFARSQNENALAAAEREVAKWEERRQAQIIVCGNVTDCSDLRCRRRKLCAALHAIASKTEASRKRLAAEQAKRPAPQREVATPPLAPNKKGRTGVRP